MLILLILLILFALFLIFCFGPALVAVIMVFRRGTQLDLDAACSSEQFAPYADLLCSGSAALQAYSHEKVAISAPDGLRLCADYYDLHAEKTVIFAHGYRSSPMVNFAAQGAAFAARGWNVLMIRQRAHGESEGMRCYLGLKEQYDLLAWADWAAHRSGIRELVLYGMSMGAVAVAYASDKLDENVVRGVVIDCGFTSPYNQIKQDCIKRHVPWRLMMPLVRALAFLCYRIDIAKPVTSSLSRTKIPAFFLHGTADATVPYKQGLANYEACASVKAMFTADGAGHTESFLLKREEAENALFTFLSSNDINNPDE